MALLTIEGIYVMDGNDSKDIIERYRNRGSLMEGKVQFQRVLRKLFFADRFALMEDSLEKLKRFVSRA